MTDSCRICDSQEVSQGRNYKPYKNFETVYYDCRDCGCRFVSRDEFVYEQLHSTQSTYSAHLELMDQAKLLFDQGDLAGLERYLGQTPKNRPVIDHLKQTPDCSRVLEFGCSRGYLSSYAILQGKEFFGVDISETAIKAATESFGDHFLLERDVGSLRGEKFDFIYHVGTIGCVDDPVGFIRSQLEMLKSKGVLLFNAPNVEACLALDLDWVIGTTPPDLVTLFPATFWQDQFSELSDVAVTVSSDPPLRSFMRRRNAGRAMTSDSQELFAPVKRPQQRHFAVRTIRRSVEKLAVLLPPVGPFSRLPQEFGVYIKMTVK